MARTGLLIPVGSNGEKVRLTNNHEQNLALALIRQGIRFPNEEDLREALRNGLSRSTVSARVPLVG